MLKYREPQLNGLLDSLNRRLSIKHRLTVDSLNWSTLSHHIHGALVLEDKVKERRIKDGFAWFWQTASKRYRDETAHAEYNSIKHGLRASSGGSTLRVGLQPDPETPAPPESMMTVMASDYGSHFLEAERIGSDKLSFGVKSRSANWHPQALITCIQLCSFTIYNLKTFLLSGLGFDVTKMQFQWPADLSLFKPEWTVRLPGYSSTSFGPVIDENELWFPTVEDISGSYDIESETSEDGEPSDGSDEDDGTEAANEGTI
ncbi:MAG: hypothetical protein GKR89_02310 [Candidatus Latescibacteria bacterium]|nr:hypothetical protein [Candidatus Latescibacterota bacterium]